MPPMVRRVIALALGATFLTVIFVLLPLEVAQWSAEQGWPRWRTVGGQGLGAALFTGTLGLVLYCSRLFAVFGKGTPVPVDPPKELVVAGVYRFSRNPMYVGQVSILLSYFLYFGHLALLVYALTWAVFVHAFVVWIEEPQLRRRFGVPYEAYTREVPRWLGIPRRGGTP